MQARGRAAQDLWQAYVQQRRASLGLSLPSSKSLWDVVNRRLLEPHGAEAVHDIWIEARSGGPGLLLPPLGLAAMWARRGGRCAARSGASAGLAAAAAAAETAPCPTSWRPHPPSIGLRSPYPTVPF